MSECISIEIDQNGNLLVERKPGCKIAQICPFSHYHDNCGDWCPFFDANKPPISAGKLIYQVELNCVGNGMILESSHFKDARK